MFFEEVTHNVSEIIDSMLIRMFKQNQNGKDSVSLKSGDIAGLLWREQRHRQFGKCFTFRALDEHRDLGIYYIKFKL